MEKVLENAIDNGLGRISSGLYLFSIGLGIVLIILGVILIFKNRGSKEKKKTANVADLSPYRHSCCYKRMGAAIEKI